MEERLYVAPPRGTLRRRISLLITSLLVVLFTIAGPLISNAAAATTVDAKASWTGSDVSYVGSTYTPTTAAPPYKNSQSEYQFIVQGNPDIAQVIYFDVPAAQAQTATTATRVNYIMDGSKYTEPSGVISIGVVPAGKSDPAAAPPKAAATTEASSCDATYFGGLGWLICSASQWIASGVNGVYNILKQFLEVNTVTQSDNGIYQIWAMVRTIADICFILIFLVIVYTYITGFGVTNHALKEMVPRLLIAAILVNFSFWICQFFIDISNILGYSIEAIFNRTITDLKLNVQINWSDLTTYILSGGAIVTSALGFGVVAGGGFGALGFLLLGALISVGFSVLVAFVILAARQAFIVVLVMLAPLAFVAMVLPSTKSLFEKWRKALTTLLIFFPIFGLLFGGSELAGMAIVNSQYHNQVTAGQTATSSGSLVIILIGLAVQMIPLAITPMIVQFSSGLLGKVAGMANDRKRGLVDRAKNWTQSNADDLRMRKLAGAAQRRDQQRRTENGLQRFGRSFRPSNIGLAFDRSKSDRERRIKRNTEFLSNRGEAIELERINNPQLAHTTAGHNFYARQRQRIEQNKVNEGLTGHQRGEIEGEARERLAGMLQTDVNLRGIRQRTAAHNGAAEVIEANMKATDNLAVAAMIEHTPHLRAQAVRTKSRENEAAAYKAIIDSEGDDTWKQREQTTGYLRIMRSRTNDYKSHAADLEAGMAAADQLEYIERVNTSNAMRYQEIRHRRVQTKVDEQRAQSHKAMIDAEGDARWRQFEYNDPTMRQIRETTHIDRQRASDLDTAMTNADQRTYNTRVNTSQAPEYRIMRATRIQSGVDKSMADFQASQIEADGERAYRALFEGNSAQARDLNRRNIDIEQTKKESASIANTLQKRADAHYDHLSQIDARLKGIRLREEDATQSAETEKNNWDEMLDDVRNNGSQAAGIDTRTALNADSVKNRYTAANQSQRRVKDRQAISSSRADRAYKESDEGKRFNLQQQVAKEELEVVEADESARIQEMHTEEGAKNLTDPEQIQAAKALHEADYNKRAQSRRSANATTVADQEYAKAVIDDNNLPGSAEKITDVAAGIAGKAGVSQARATAKQTVVEAYKKGVGAEKTLLSKTPNAEILEQLSNPDILNESEERLAALGGTIADRKHMASHIKLWSQVGAMHKAATQGLKDAQKSGNTEDINAAKAKLDKIKTLEQQIHADRSKTPFSLGSKDLGDAEIGEYEGNIYESMRDRIMSTLSPENMSKMDPDEMRLIFEMARSGKLDDEEMEKVRSSYDEWKNDEILGKTLQDKYRVLFDPFVTGNFPQPTRDSSGKISDSDPWKSQFEEIENDTVLSSLADHQQRKKASK